MNKLKKINVYVRNDLECNQSLDASSIQSLFIKIPNLQNRTNPVYKC